MRILYLSRWYPFPPNNGSKIRAYNLLKKLSQHHQVRVLSFAGEGEGQLQPVDDAGIASIETVAWKPYQANHPRSLLSLFNLAPRSLVFTYSQEMEAKIVRLLKEQPVDLVIANEKEMACYVDLFNHLPSIYENVENGAFFQLKQAEGPLHRRIRHWLTWMKLEQYLSRQIRKFSGCTVVSKEELEIFRQVAPGYKPVGVIPNCVDLAQYDIPTQPCRPNTLIFTGSFSFIPNYLGTVWFIEQVLPLITAQVPDVHLLITGNPDGKVLPPCQNVTHLGFVDDIRPLVASSAVSIAPILQGGGSRLKILEAMALKTPVVATSKGAEGLSIEDHTNILIADLPQETADAVVWLLRNPENARQIGQKGYELVKKRYNWDNVFPEFHSLMDQVLA